MLIDESYFQGPLSIGQLGQQSVVDKLNIFINRYEPEILGAVLGNDLYVSFLNGLDVSSGEPIDQRWLDLLNGVSFTNGYSCNKRWNGIAPASGSSNIYASGRSDLIITAGITPGFPVGDYQYTDATLDGWDFKLEWRGIGQMFEHDEWEKKDGGGIVMNDTTKETQSGEKWIISFIKRTSSSSNNHGLYSPVAGIIYWHWKRDEALQSVGVGTAKTQAENATIVMPDVKINDAWNDAVNAFEILWDYLRVNKTVYESDGYLSSTINDRYFGRFSKRVNWAGI